ncbi:MAG: hypothetical protein ACRDFW_10295 [bacterium]
MATTATLFDEYCPGERQGQYEVRNRQVTPDIAITRDLEIEPLQAILRLGSLPHGWDRAGSPAPLHEAMDVAIHMVLVASRLGLEELSAPSVFPVPGGGVQLEWREEDRVLEIEILPDGSAQFVAGIDGDPRDEGEVPIWPPTKLASLLSWLVAGA